MIIGELLEDKKIPRFKNRGFFATRHQQAVNAKPTYIFTGEDLQINYLYTKLVKSLYNTNLKS
ncbi:hypothetical protein GCM10023173_20420 [Sphingobacterium thermophilum]|uniref:Uncharacterized protein n=1 Tax=Sphingobacterium thermophilum TaxID=768534 RepID=A0ABP8R589_9SPHI